MNKKLNEDALKNELAGSAFFTRTEPTDSPPPPEPKPAKPIGTKVEKKAVDQPTVQSIDQSIDRLSVDHSAVMGKPRGFYITEKQNQDLDFAVMEISKRLAGKLPFKVDRSVLIRLIIEMGDLTSKEKIDKLSTKLISRSISQLTG
jgi:hypothetical protein